MSKIVIAEDDELILKMYTKMFGLRGHEVIGAVDGQSTLELAHAAIPDAILLDVMMPNMNGLEVLDKLAVDAELKNIPVIVMSNLADEHDIDAALAKGATKYIIKSEYEPLQICQIVEQVIASQNPPAHE